MSRLVDAGGMSKHRQTLPTRALAGLAILAAAVGASVPLATAAHADAIACGTVVTSDVRLTADLLDCPGSGLVIAASSVTVDLGGHVIDGTGSGAGIDNEAGHDDVRIVGGTVRDFQFGVHLFQTSGARVERIAAASNMSGVIVARSADVQLDAVQATANVSNGIDVTFSEDVSVRRNTVTGNSSPGLVLNGSDGVVALRNHAVANDSDGIELTLVEDAVVDRNTSTANRGNGISVDQPGNSLTRNRVVDNQGLGIAAPDGTIDGGRNRAAGNLGGGCTGVVCR